MRSVGKDYCKFCFGIFTVSKVMDRFLADVRSFLDLNLCKFLFNLIFIPSTFVFDFIKTNQSLLPVFRSVCVLFRLYLKCETRSLINQPQVR